MPIAEDAALDAEAAAASAALVAAEAALLAIFWAAMVELAMSFIAALIALASLAVTLFAGVVLVHAPSPRAETAIRVRAIFFTDCFLRNGCEWFARRPPCSLDEREKRLRPLLRPPSSGPF